MPVLIAVICLYACSMAMAQQRDPARDSIVKKKIEKLHPISGVIKTNILPILWGTVPYSAEYRVLGEFMTARGQSLSIGASYLGKSLLLLFSENASANKGQVVLSVSGYRVQGAYKFYFIRKNLRPEGPYAALHTSWSSARISAKGNPSDYLLGSHFNVNLLFGAQVFAGHIIGIDFFLGPGYKINAWSEHSPGVSKNINMSDFGPMYGGHLKFNLGFNVGIAL